MIIIAKWRTIDTVWVAARLFLRTGMELLLARGGCWNVLPSKFGRSSVSSDDFLVNAVWGLVALLLIHCI
jgi:hypothetical protein